MLKIIESKEANKPIEINEAEKKSTTVKVLNQDVRLDHIILRILN